MQRRSVLISTLFLIAGAGSGQTAARRKPSFSIAVHAERMEIRPGLPARLKLTMTNTSDRDLHYSVRVLGAKSLNYKWVTVRQVELALYDSEGNPVPLTNYGKVVRGQCGECGGGGTLGILKPGESLDEEADINREFDIEKPGTYTVRATRFDKDNQALVKSDGITLIAAL